MCELDGINKAMGRKERDVITTGENQLQGPHNEIRFCIDTE
jgi:hypothetical protein